jgi:hypothetical protein
MARDPNWTIVKRMFGRAIMWRHTSGAIVKHCGHPTALRPYYVIGRDLGTFRLLKDAQTAAVAENEAA